MKRSNKWIGILLAIFMVTLTACGSGKSNTSGGSSTPKASESAPASSAAQASEKPKEETVELEFAFPTFTNIPSNMQEVQDAISKITLEKINATVKLTPISIGAYGQQLNLMLSSGEKLDVMYVSGKTYSSMVAKGQLMDLDALLEENGKEIKAAFEPGILESVKIKGKTYFIPSIRDMATVFGFAMTKEIADKYNIDVTQIKSLDDLGNAFKTIKAGEGNKVLLAPQSVGFSFLDSYKWFDPLGDSTNTGVLPNYDNNLQVVNLYETPEYAAFLKTMREWYKAGYILKDAGTNKEPTATLVKSGKVVSYFTTQKPGLAAQESKLIGKPILTGDLTSPAYTLTSGVTSVNLGIPHQAKHPEKSMQFLNLMYSDEDLINLLDWGIEGKDYVKKGDVIGYPDGIDSSNVAYGLNQGWLFGNQFISHVFEGNDPNIWNLQKEFNKSGVPSKALGFSFDPEPVKAEFAAVSNVITQFKLPLETGSVDPDKVLPDFISKLKASGIEKIIAEKQSQLDEWSKHQ